MNYSYFVLITNMYVVLLLLDVVIISQFLCLLCN
jgi:hypothetical protein